MEEEFRSAIVTDVETIGDGNKWEGLARRRRVCTVHEDGSVCKCAARAKRLPAVTGSESQSESEMVLPIKTIDLRIAKEPAITAVADPNVAFPMIGPSWLLDWYTEASRLSWPQRFVWSFDTVSL